MAKRRGGKGRTVKSTSVLTALFAVTPALFVLTNTPSGSPNSPLGLILTSTGASWGNIGAAGWALAQNVIQNWVAILILLAVIFVAIHLTRKAGRGAKITKHLRM